MSDDLIEVHIYKYLYSKVAELFNQGYIDTKNCTTISNFRDHCGSRMYSQKANDSFLEGIFNPPLQTSTSRALSPAIY